MFFAFVNQGLQQWLSKRTDAMKFYTTRCILDVRLLDELFVALIKKSRQVYSKTLKFLDVKRL